MNHGFSKTAYRSQTFNIIIPKLDKCLNFGITYMQKHKPTKTTIRYLLLNEKKFDLFRSQIDAYNLLPLETQELEKTYRKMKETWLNQYEQNLKKKNRHRKVEG
ncbi:MAG: hypothetical protein ACTSWX_13520 [Promethearchaeota archaeon]